MRNPTPSGTVILADLTADSVSFFFFLFFAAPHGMQEPSFPPGMEHAPLAFKTQSLNHWTAWGSAQT